MSKKSVAKPRSSPAQPSEKKGPERSRTRRAFTDEFRREAVAMLFDGHSASSVAERLGITTNMLYRWKSAQLKESGPVAESLEARVHVLSPVENGGAFRGKIWVKMAAHMCAVRGSDKMVRQPHFERLQRGARKCEEIWMSGSRFARTCW